MPVPYCSSSYFFLSPKVGRGAAPETGEDRLSGPEACPGCGFTGPMAALKTRRIFRYGAGGRRPGGRTRLAVCT